MRGSSDADRVPNGLEVVRVDFLDPGSMVHHLEGVDVIHRVAGAVKARCQEEFDRANAASTAALVKAANTACPDARFVLTSSQAAAGPCGTGPVTAYGRSKLLAERAVTGFHDHTIIRPPAVFGPGDEATKNLFKWATRGFFASPNTKGAFCAIFVDDLAELLLKVIDHPETRGRILQPSYPQRITWEGFTPPCKGRGKEDPSSEGSQGCRSLRGRNVRGNGRNDRRLPMVTRDRLRELTAGEWVLRQDEVEALLGWQPGVPLEEALRHSLGSNPP
ncbi:MAG: NAD(P)-dependent oxidoreductase [Candidatus Moduliflexus flocculans]|nr:NAD(P)-dependent oxidoreductase [Candidatus Moduliflexus flocculans]